MPRPDPNAITLLRSSLAFKLSLAAKELFHSNVLEWALLEYPGLCQCLFGIPAPTVNGKVDDSRMRVSRERERMDLIIEIVDPQHPPTLTVIAVENKLKCMPTSGQLDEYAEKLVNWKTYYWTGSTAHGSSAPLGPDLFADRRDPGCAVLTPQRIRCFLMAPAVPNFFRRKWQGYYYASRKPARRVVAWAYLDYLRWTGVLACNSRKAPPSSNGYTLQFIHDYVKSLDDGVIKLVKDERDAMRKQSHTRKLHEVRKETWGDRDLRDLRIHDLLGKTAYDAILEKILGRLPKWLSNGRLQVYSGWSRGTPMFALQFVLPSTPATKKPNAMVMLGVQVQEFHYRRFIQKEDIAGKWTDVGTARYKLLQHTVQHWMLMGSQQPSRYPFNGPSMLGCHGKRETPVTSVSLAINHLFKYGDDFVYLRANIPRQCTVDCLVEETVRDLVALAKILYPGLQFGPTPAGCNCPSTSPGENEITARTHKATEEVDGAQNVQQIPWPTDGDGTLDKGWDRLVSQTIEEAPG